MVQKHSILIACLVLVPACSSDDTTDTLDGTTPLDLGTGQDSFWIDTDGVDPEVAGCHIEYTDDTCTTIALSDRNFGEFCQQDGTLVESNPGAGLCHVHENDIGHPYVVDCAGWCMDTFILPTGQRRGVASVTGDCEAVLDVPCDQGVVDSARCVCQ